jgi:hypothetical protein
MRMMAVIVMQAVLQMMEELLTETPGGCQTQKDILK